MGRQKNVLIVVAGLWLLLVFSQNAFALTPTEAGQKGIDWMVPDTISWQNRNTCFGCHVQGETIWGLSIGKSRGYTIDTQKMKFLVDSVKNWQCLTDGSWYWGWSCTSTWRNETTVYAASALAFYDRMVATDAQDSLLKAAAYLKAKQLPGGYWTMNSNGGIIMNGPYYWGTAMGIIAMKRAADLTSDTGYKTSYEKAVAWLKTQTSTLVQDNAFMLIGLLEGGVPNTDQAVTNIKNKLLSYQNSDGGWGTYRGYSSNAYNTGQAVYSLRLAGMLLQDSQIDAGIKWLVANQNSAGYWPTGSSGTSTLFSSTMWPVIALGQFGTLGVEISADPLMQQIFANDPLPQTAQYTITVKNTGTQIKDDTYDLSVTGAMEGWTALLSQPSVTLVPGESGNVILTVTAPPGLPLGLPSMLTINAVSKTSKDVTASVMVTTYTPPEPPVTGHKTSVSIVQGNNSVISVCDKITLSAEVIDQVSGAKLAGPGIGAVNFLVAGIAVGSATDEAGQGTFTVAWTPGSDWTKLNSQSVLAVYSGFDFPDTEADLLSSHATGSITINPGVCNQAPVANAGQNQTLECGGPGGTLVTLDGSKSSDPDGDQLIYTWTWRGGNASGVRPSVTLPYGTTTVTLVVNDGKTDSLPAETTITVKDTMAPVTSLVSIGGVVGSNGWYRSPVTITLLAADLCSGVKQITYAVDGTANTVSGASASFPVTSEGTHQVTYYAADGEGNTETSHPLTIKIDQTAPTIDAKSFPAPNGNGWTNTDVAVKFECNDAPVGIASGIAGCTAPVTIMTDGAGQTVTGTAEDNAGNTTNTSATLNIDKTAPIITATVSPAANANGWNNSDVTITYTCSDTMSGIASCPAPVTVTTEGAGQLITGTAVDKAGNSATVPVTLNIDKSAPVIPSLIAGPSILWPPNHKMVDVLISGGAIDAYSNIASIVITVSDEYGIYNMTVPGFGSIIQLEAWREGTDRDGRNYTITAVVTDKAGNQSTSTKTVLVPHDMR